MTDASLECGEFEPLFADAEEYGVPAFFVAGGPAQLEQLLGLAQYSNLALKWCHAPALLSDTGYPYRDVLPLLRRLIEAFGVERVMWASDVTQARAEANQTLAQLLYYVLDSDQLSESEKAWLLGRSVRQALRRPPAGVSSDD